jgi:mRNA-degrading endonuclease toxin of MazEF toxin-antitoxin module
VSDLPYTGDVYWCALYPGLHGHAAKPRFCVVISPPDKLPEDENGTYLTVPTSESTLSQFAIGLPNKADTPQTTSGLPRPCKAVCDEYKLVPLSTLTTWKGDLRTPLVSKLQNLVLKVMQARKAEREAASPAPDARKG